MCTLYHRQPVGCLDAYPHTVIFQTWREMPYYYNSPDTQHVSMVSTSWLSGRVFAYQPEGPGFEPRLGGQRVVYGSRLTPSLMQLNFHYSSLTNDRTPNICQPAMSRRHFDVLNGAICIHVHDDAIVA